MIKFYKTTHLEDFVEHLYKVNKIVGPNDLSIDNISGLLKIMVRKLPIKGMSYSSTLSKNIIFLDERNSPLQQRYDFFHELAHVLLHFGNQVSLPKEFVQKQEIEAENFMLYSMMPISMIRRLDLPPDRKLAVQFLADTFAVGKEFAIKRYDQILRREMEGEVTREISSTLQSKKEVEMEYADQPQFSVVYDSSGVSDGPSQMVVTLDEWTMINCREIELPIGERLPEMDHEEIDSFDGISITPGDVTCFDGQVMLLVGELLYRHGLNRRRFVVNMRDVDMLIARDREMSRRMSW